MTGDAGVGKFGFRVDETDCFPVYPMDFDETRRNESFELPTSIYFLMKDRKVLTLQGPE